jgi:hypothetical protein
MADKKSNVIHTLVYYCSGHGKMFPAPDYGFSQADAIQAMDMPPACQPLLAIFLASIPRL